MSQEAQTLVDPCLLQDLAHGASALCLQYYIGGIWTTGLKTVADGRILTNDMEGFIWDLASDMTVSVPKPVP